MGLTNGGIVLPFHRGCGTAMRILPNGRFVRCGNCDSGPVHQSCQEQVELRKPQGAGLVTGFCGHERFNLWLEYQTIKTVEAAVEVPDSLFHLPCGCSRGNRGTAEYRQFVIQRADTDRKEWWHVGCSKAVIFVPTLNRIYFPSGLIPDLTHEVWPS